MVEITKIPNSLTKIELDRKFKDEYLKKSWAKNKKKTFEIVLVETNNERMKKPVFQEFKNEKK